MATKQWTVRTGAETHKVVVSWSRITNAGEIRVDGTVVNTWGFALYLGNRRFRVGGKDALARWVGPLEHLTTCELVVDGKEVAAQQ